MNSRNGGIRYIRWAALVTAALLTAVATIGVAPQARAAAETEKTLGVTHYRQNQSQWCWATAAQVAVMYLRNVQNSQCSYVNHAHNTTTCKNEVGSWGDVEKLVDDYLGVGGNWTSGALTSVTLRSSINAYHPVISYIVWRSGGGHFMTTYGYYYLGNDPGTFVYYSNADGAVGTGTNATRGSRTIQDFASNNSFQNTGNMANITN